MSLPQLLILHGCLAPESSSDACETLDLQAFVRLAYSGYWWRRIRTYETVRLLSQNSRCLPRRWRLTLLLWLLSRGQCELWDTKGSVERVTGFSLAADAFRCSRDAIGQLLLLRRVQRRLSALERLRGETSTRGRLDQLIPLRRGVLYLKTDLWLQVEAGGSVTHMAGIANELAKRLDRVQVWSLSINPLLDAGLFFRRLLPPDRYWDFRETPLLAFNEALIDQLAIALADSPPRWIYQRYSLHNFSGVWAATVFNVPFVMEYNGSEVWIAKWWGDGLRWPELAERVERLNLMSAHTVVVVSAVLKKELIARGVDPQRIVIVPNGVDIDVYSPLVSSGRLREEWGLRDKTVIGFIGTFGRWHGVELLIEAFARLQKLQPENASICLLLIGDGPTRSLCEELAEKLGISSLVRFSGLVKQQQGPQWLSACDVLVSPQMPNPDGSEFFGSPTKIFEYMAMGKPIIAARLGQIERILKHGESAWLFEAGNVESLATGLNALVGDPVLCERLATNSREEAVAHHTWGARVDRVLCRLGEPCNLG